MKNIKLPTDEEIAVVTRATKERGKTEPSVVAASYDRVRAVLVLQMRGGAMLCIPPRLLRGLEAATPVQLAGVKTVSEGSSLHWDEIDVQMTVPAILTMALGVPLPQVSGQAGGRIGGKAKSDRKAEAVRANGAKGGRPRKVAA